MNKRPEQEQPTPSNKVDALDVLLKDLQDEERTMWIHAVSVMIRTDENILGSVVGSERRITSYRY